MDIVRELRWIENRLYAQLVSVITLRRYIEEAKEGGGECGRECLLGAGSHRVSDVGCLEAEDTSASEKWEPDGVQD